MAFQKNLSSHFAYLRFLKILDCLLSGSDYVPIPSSCTYAAIVLEVPAIHKAQIVLLDN